MAGVVDVVSFVLIGLGAFFVVTGAVGILRMPDVYTRMHAASVIDTLGGALLVLGLCLQAPSVLVVFKLLVVLALLFFIGPVASHALAQAALEAGVEPKLDDDRRGREVDGDPDGHGVGTGELET